MSRDGNEIVVVEVASDVKLRLYGHLTARMQELGYAPGDYKALHLGVDLPLTWPVNCGYEVTLAQLVVLAQKLQMRIVITNFCLENRKEERSPQNGDDAGIPE